MLNCFSLIQNRQSECQLRSFSLSLFILASRAPNRQKVGTVSAMYYVCNNAAKSSIQEERSMSVKITRAKVLLGFGSDTVLLYTDMPSSMPNVTKQPLMLRFDAAYNTGADYVKHIFGIEAEVVNTRHDDK